MTIRATLPLMLAPMGLVRAIRSGTLPRGWPERARPHIPRSRVVVPYPATTRATSSGDCRTSASYPVSSVSVIRPGAYRFSTWTAPALRRFHRATENQARNKISLNRVSTVSGEPRGPRERLTRGRYTRTMALPEDYWSSFECHIDAFGGYIDAIRTISAYQAATGANFVWRGAVDSTWALHSSLVRRYLELNGRLPTEAQLKELERRIVLEAKDWSLDWHAGGGRLAGLELLAALQHYGAPTRLIDFTFNPLIALWFAVERMDSFDGRIFAVDISDRIVDRVQASGSDPWWFHKCPDDWARRSWVWRPPPFEPRMVPQDGCFLIGGIPGTVPARNVKEPGQWRLLRAAEVRECMSLPFSLIQYDQTTAAAEGRRLTGRPPVTRAFTLRIGNKAELRLDLERTFGYTHATVYPDFPGFAQHAAAVGRRV